MYSGDESRLCGVLAFPESVLPLPFHLSSDVGGGAALRLVDEDPVCEVDA